MTSNGHGQPPSYPPRSASTPRSTFEPQKVPAVQPSSTPPPPRSSRRASAKAKRHSSPLWLLYALVVLAALSLVCFQIYRISTGQVKSAVMLDKAEDQKLVQSLETPTGEVYTPIDNEHVQKVLGLDPIQPAQLDGNDSQVTFRTMGGEIVCTISKQLGENQADMVPMPINANSEAASGEGAVCAAIHNLPAHTPVGSCSQGKLRTSVIGVWGDSEGLGTCTEGTTPLYQDASENRANNVDGKRFAYQPLGLSQYTQVGKYACGLVDSGVSCVDVTTGKGFSMVENLSYELF